MDYEILRSVLEDYIMELIDNSKRVSKKFRKSYHINRHEMEYETWRKMLKGKQKWTLEYFLKTADSFSIPPHEFTAELLKRIQNSLKTLP